MPQFSVTLEEQNSPNPLWARTTLRVKARSTKHAMKKAEAKFYTVGFAKQYLAVSARRYDTDHEYWHKIWRRAYNNMPTRIYVAVDETWVPQVFDTTTLPDFIKGLAKGTMRREPDGVVYKKLITRKPHRMGAEAALTRLLQYAKWNKLNSMAHYAVSNAMMRGSRPKTAERRELLLKLAGPGGTRIAAEMLGRRFQPLKLKGGK